MTRLSPLDFFYFFAASLILLCTALPLIVTEHQGEAMALRCLDGGSLPGACAALSRSGDLHGVFRRDNSHAPAKAVDSGIFTDNYGNPYLVTLYSDYAVSIRGA